MTKIQFELDGKQVEADAGRDDLAGRQAPGPRDPASVLFARTGLSPRRQLPRLHGGGRGRARAGGLLQAHAQRRHEGEVGERPRRRRAKNGDGASGRRPAGARNLARSGFEILALGRKGRSHRKPLPRRRALAGRRQPSRHARQSRRLHPVRPVRARLPRGPGQRRDRHGLSQPRFQDRVRLRRSDGRIDLRRLRRMRAGLPDRRADAVGAARREPDPHRSTPTGRSIRCARSAASAARSPIRSRTRRSSTPRAAMVRPTTTASASRAASASTTSTIRIA